jgi:hypothetical protein
MIRDVVSVRDKTRIHYRRLGQGPGQAAGAVIEAVLRFVGDSAEAGA